MKKGKEKKEENYIKKGGKGLKNASFRAIISKYSRGGLPTPPPAVGRGVANLFVGKKK